jgi:DNA-binding response OmpR family regulator
MGRGFFDKRLFRARLFGRIRSDKSGTHRAQRKDHKMGTDSGDKWRILCIDDEPDVLEILRVALGTKHEVATASDGLEAVGMLDACEADFVICDVRMPKMDGFQTVQAIRKHPKYSTIPVFFLTAATSREKAKKGFESGANLYLTKPFDPMRVLQNIDFFLDESGQKPRPKKIPIDRLDQETAPLSSPPRAFQTSDTRVIIVTHMENQVNHIYSALRGKFEVVACADPLASLQQLVRYDPDILIVNPGIPHLSGWGLVQMIRLNPRFRKLPILLIQDPVKPLDERLIPSITRHPLLQPEAAEDEIVGAVIKAIKSDEFVFHPKQAALSDLVAEENALHSQLKAEQSKQQGRENTIRDRYRKIQEFIDQNQGA